MIYNFTNIVLLVVLGFSFCLPLCVCLMNSIANKYMALVKAPQHRKKNGK